MPSEVEKYLSENPEPQSVDVLVADNNGILRGKQFPGSQLAKLYDKGVNFPLSLLYGDAQGGTPAAVLDPPLGGDPDRVYMPVAGSLRTVPWADVPTVQVFVEPYQKDNTPHRFSPQTCLNAVIKRLNDEGLFPTIALEGEFYLVDPAKSPPQPLQPENGWPSFEGPQVYAIEPLQDVQGFLDEVKSVAEAQSIALTSVVCEYGEGQFELNLNHTNDPAAACLEFLMLKRAIKNIAFSRGQLASFMAKPVKSNPGSGCHIHVSMSDDDGNNIFGADEKTLHHAIGGVLDSMAESVALITPYANSYRRFVKGGWSPSTGNWGENHRGVSVRIPMSGTKDRRLEHRVAGADVNPYLLTAAVLSGMHKGINEKTDPGEPNIEGQADVDGRELPTRWREALQVLDGSVTFRDYLGTEFLDMFLRAKFAEEESFHAEISDRDFGWCLRTV